ncbi:MAG: MBL fold metallo-hydrolase [Acidimicrobiia bacterium]|nr:MBL fold metallo-hydrolase [Acidimicrobiia bacterium]
MGWHYESDRMRIGKVCVGALENNAYVVCDAATGRGVLIDAPDEPETLLQLVAGVEVESVLITHGHHDHIGAIGVAADLGVPILIHPGDSDALEVPTIPLKDGDAIDLGTVVVRAIHTPGHTPGSTCFTVDGVLFSGDTLFPGGPGATRSPDAFATVMRSLDEHLFALPDDTLVMPGHGLDTTIGAERPHVEEWRTRGW